MSAAEKGRIELSSVRKTYRMGGTDVHALDSVDLRIEGGEFVAIMGPSGSGKSTLMNILGLLDVPDSGSYKLGGREVSALGDEALSRVRSDEIGFVFQQFNLLPRTSALENVALPRLYTTGRLDLSTARELLEKVGLAERLEHTPAELSGGQQQRVAIARSLVNAPSVLLADEPTGNLDSASEKEIMRIFSRLNEVGITVILVTHEEEIARHARRIVRMRDGKIVSDERSVNEPSGRAAPPDGEDARPAFFGNARRMIAHLREAFRALGANKIRTMLSMLGILIGVAAVVAVVALGAGAKQSVEAQLSSLGSNLLTVRAGSARVRGVSLEAGAVTRFNEQDARVISERVANVVAVAPSVSGRAQIVAGSQNWSSQIQGTTPAYAAMRAAKPVVGRFFTEEEDRSRSKVVVLGMTPVKELFGGQNPVGESVKINRISFQVIGVLPERGATSWRDQDDVALVPLNTAMRRLLGKDYVDSIDVQIASPEALPAAQEAIGDLIRKRRRLPQEREDTFEVRNMAEIQETLAATSRTLAWLLSTIAAVSLLVGGIGIMNIMLVSVTERTREIGLRKALGATGRDILWQFLIEAVVVSVMGGLCGIALAWGIATAIAELAGWPVIISVEALALATVFSGAVGVLFGIWPAWKASLLHPINALRYE